MVRVQLDRPFKKGKDMITQLVLWVCFIAVIIGGFDGRMGFGLWVASMILTIIAFQLDQLKNIIKGKKEIVKSHHPLGTSNAYKGIPSMWHEDDAE